MAKLVVYCYAFKPLPKIIVCPSTQGCTNHMNQVAMVTKFCAMSPNICGSSVWNLFDVTLLVPMI